MTIIKQINNRRVSSNQNITSNQTFVCFEDRPMAWQMVGKGVCNIYYISKPLGKMFVAVELMSSAVNMLWISL